MVIDGFLTKRPAGSHPSPNHWEVLRELIRERQGGACGTCWRTGDLELHHRHYDRWGQERPEDVIMLCRDCHEAITSRIRAERYRKEGRLPDIPDTEDEAPRRRYAREVVFPVGIGPSEGAEIRKRW